MTDIILGLDMDGVIIDHAPTILAWAKQHGQELTPSEAIFHNLDKFFGPEELDQLFDKMYETKEGVSASVLMAGAMKGLEELHEFGVPIYLLSRRNSREVARDTLVKLGLWPKYFDSANTFFVERSIKKREIAQQLGITHYVDDQPGALQGAMAQVPHRVLFDQHNVLPRSSSYMTVLSWRELVSEVEKSSRETV